MEPLIPEKEFAELERRFTIMSVDELAKKHPDIPHWSTLP